MSINGTNGEVPSKYGVCHWEGYDNARFACVGKHKRDRTGNGYKMPAPIMNHCPVTDEQHEAHFWEREGDNFFEGDAYQWCDGISVALTQNEGRPSQET